jgi:hypothetical protein
MGMRPMTRQKVAGCASPSSAGGHHGQTRFPVGDRPSPDADIGGGCRHSDHILPDVKRADAAAADVFQSSPLTLEAEPRSFCAATARRLMEIARRNEIRREAKLLLLSIPKELRRMKKQEELEEFERFQAAYRKVVWEEVLAARLTKRKPVRGCSRVIEIGPAASRSGPATIVQ